MSQLETRIAECIPGFELSGDRIVENNINRLLADKLPDKQKLKKVEPILDKLEKVAPPHVREACYKNKWDKGTLFEKVESAIALEATMPKGDWTHLLSQLQLMVANESYKLACSSLKRDPITDDERIFFAKNISKVYNVFIWLPDLLTEDGVDADGPVEYRMLRIVNIFDRKLNEDQHHNPMLNAIVEAFSFVSIYERFKAIVRKLTAPPKPSDGPAKIETKIAYYNHLIDALTKLTVT
jgi:hypothetical protein